MNKKPNGEINTALWVCGLLLLLPMSLYVPAWGVAIFSFILGCFFQNFLKDILSVLSAAFIFWFCSAYYYDGLISSKTSEAIAALFGFSSPWFSLVGAGVVGSLLVLPFYLSGFFAGRWFAGHR